MGTPLEYGVIQKIRSNLNRQISTSYCTLQHTNPNSLGGLQFSRVVSLSSLPPKDWAMGPGDFVVLWPRSPVLDFVGWALDGTRVYVQCSVSPYVEHDKKFEHMWDNKIRELRVIDFFRSFDAKSKRIRRLKSVPLDSQRLHAESPPNVASASSSASASATATRRELLPNEHYLYLTTSNQKAIKKTVDALVGGEWVKLVPGAYLDSFLAPHIAHLLTKVSHQLRVNAHECAHGSCFSAIGTQTERNNEKKVSDWYARAF
jgi:hypothetical protein